MPSRSCTSFVARRAKGRDGPNGFISRRKGVVKQRHKLVRCAVKRHGNLNVSSSAPVFIGRLHPRAGRIILYGSRHLFSHSYRISGVGCVTRRGLAKPIGTVNGVHCSRTNTPYALCPRPSKALLTRFSRPRHTVAPNRTTIFCRSSRILYNKAVRAR